MKYKLAQDNAKLLISQFGVKENKMVHIFQWINRLHDFANFMFESWSSPNTKSTSHKQQLALRRVRHFFFYREIFYQFYLFFIFIFLGKGFHFYFYAALYEGIIH